MFLLNFKDNSESLDGISGSLLCLREGVPLRGIDFAIEAIPLIFFLVPTQIPQGSRMIWKELKIHDQTPGV
jgi:hypothetical protein